MHQFPTNIPAVLLFTFLLLMSCRTGTDSDASVSGVNVMEPAVVNCRIRANPDYISPYQSFRAYTNTIVEYCFQKLLERDKNTFELKPVLAKSVPTPVAITEGKFAGGYKWDFEILDEAVWDNGTPITGYDYLTSMKFVFNPAGTRYLPVFQDFLKWFGDIQVDENNPKRFTVYSKHANYKMIDNSGDHVLPAYAYDPEGVLEAFSFSDFRDAAKIPALKKNPALISIDSLFSSPRTTQEVENIIGSGPYKITSWNQNIDVVLTKKQDWWGANLLDKRPGFVANPKSIKFNILPDDAAVIAKTKNGELDIVSTLSGTAFENLKKNELVSSNYDFETVETVSMNYMGLNNNSPKFSDVRVRRAFSCLTDRETIIKDVYQGNALPLYGPIPPKYAYANNKPSDAFDVEKARGLLTEAGWTDTNGDGTIDKMIDGKRVEFTVDFLCTPTNTTVQQMLLILKDDFKKAGIQLNQRTLEPRELSAERSKGNFEIYTAGSALGGDHYEAYQYWHTESPYNFFGAGSAKMDKMIEDLMVQLDEKEIHKRYVEFLEEFEKVKYIVFLNTPKERLLLNKRLKGYKSCFVRPHFQANFPHL